MKKYIIFLISITILLSLTGNIIYANQNQEVYTIVAAHAGATTTADHAGMEMFKEYIEANSNGRLKMDIYPNAQLGADRELIEGIQMGQVTFMMSSSAPQVMFVPSAVVFDTPFVFQDMEEAIKIVNEPNFKTLLAKEYEKKGIHYCGTTSQGFRTLTCNKEIHTPKDMEGVTIRTMENKYHMALWREIGANPTPLAFNELYTALQQGVSDAQENPIELIHSQKFYEQQDYLIRTNHILQVMGWLMDLNFYQSLPDDLKKIVDDGLDKMMPYVNDIIQTNVSIKEQEIKDYGVTFIELTEEERGKFEEKAKAVWPLIEENCDPEIYNAFMDAREKIRNQ